MFQMMARSVNEGGKVSPIAAIRNFQVLEYGACCHARPRSPMVEFRSGIAMAARPVSEMDS